MLKFSTTVEMAWHSGIVSGMYYSFHGTQYDLMRLGPRILPVHKKGKTTGDVTHFIAIQKDVTLLKNFADREPIDWSAPEVAMYHSLPITEWAPFTDSDVNRWLEANEFGQFGRTFVIKGIDGRHLFRMDKTEISEVLGIEAEATEKDEIWNLICELRTKSKQAVAEQWEQAKQKTKAGNIIYRSPSGYFLLISLWG